MAWRVSGVGLRCLDMARLMMPLSILALLARSDAFMFRLLSSAWSQSEKSVGVGI